MDYPKFIVSYQKDNPLVYEVLSLLFYTFLNCWLWWSYLNSAVFFPTIAQLMKRKLFEYILVFETQTDDSCYHVSFWMMLKCDTQGGIDSAPHANDSFLVSCKLFDKSTKHTYQLFNFFILLIIKPVEKNLSILLLWAVEI